MPLNNYEHNGKPGSALLGDEDCPKCGSLMEPVDIEVEGLPIQKLRLCPECYLVTWNDEFGFQSRQGVPMKKGFSPDAESSAGNLGLGARKFPEC